MLKAKAFALDALAIMVILLAAFEIVEMLTGWDIQISGRTASLFAIGLAYLLASYKFLRLEENGEIK